MARPRSRKETPAPDPDAPSEGGRPPRGIAPATLIDQVRNTAAFTLEEPRLLGPGRPATVVREGASTEVGSLPYFQLLLAAHYLTVGTFVPTDVDARIRHHTFVDLDGDGLEAAVARVDAIAAEAPALVSARVVSEGGPRGISGHDGEWFSVRAGALGRALALGHEALVEALAGALDEELAREARAFDTLSRDKGRVLEAVRAATVLAHNAGDLSRVVEQWPRKPEYAAVRQRYERLGHGATDRFGGAFARAGAFNKAVTALENHRFLALRKPRGLRKSRDLLLPIGPFFDDWGRTVAVHAALDDGDRAEVVEALLATHLQGPEQQGCLRALAALHEHVPGGLDRLADDLPARMRKLVAQGPVRDALRVQPAQHDARLEKAFRRWVP